MSTMLHKSNAPFAPPALFTIPEAAWVAEIDARAVRNDIKKNVVEKVLSKNDGNAVLLDSCAVSYFRAVRHLHDSLAVELRRRIQLEIRDALNKDLHARTVSFDHFELRLDSIVKEIRQRINDVRETHALVNSNPKIRGGDPVVRGTRIPVRLLAQMRRNGASIRDLSEAYSLSTRQVELALLFDQLHPKVGRPAAENDDQWSDLGDIDRAEVEELGEFRQS